MHTQAVRDFNWPVDLARCRRSRTEVPMTTVSALEVGQYCSGTVACVAPCWLNRPTDSSSTSASSRVSSNWLVRVKIELKVVFVYYQYDADWVNNKQVCVEPHQPALNTTLYPHLLLSAWSMVPEAIDRYLLQMSALSSKPVGHPCCCRSIGQTDVPTTDRYV